MPRPSPALFSGLLLAAALALALAAVCANYQQVFATSGQTFFVDADCYSRMARVRAVTAHPGLVLKEHDFENAPFGTRPHTTVPLDYATAALAFLFKPFFGSRALDLAGAWISPLFGLLTIAFVWSWGANLGSTARWLGLLVLAASPIVAHCFELGRPDHQSLILACLACALGAEWHLWRVPPRPDASSSSSDFPSLSASPDFSHPASRIPHPSSPPSSFRLWGLVSGVAWAVGLWTSLYEPVILFAFTVLAALVWNRAIFRQRARLPGLAVGGVILLLALCIEGWRIDAPPGFGEENAAGFFSAWSRQIGELASLPPWSATLYAWTGLALVAAPVLLLLNRTAERPVARANLLLLVAVFLLTCWQVRWGYFLPLVYTLSLPWQFGAIPPRWHLAAALAVLLGLWPMAHEWLLHLHPPPALQESLAENRKDAVLLREAGDFIRRATAESPSTDDPPATTILAPWWLSPPLAYWSGQPAIAGSSHEALPGTVDVARFFMATDARQAAAILARRRVRWVVAYEPSRVQSTSADLLGLIPPPPRFMDLVLYEHPPFAPRYLRLAMVNPYFKIYEVRVGSLPHE